MPPDATPSDPRRLLAARAAAALVLVGGAVLLALQVAQAPPLAPGAGLAPLSLPRAGKLLALLHALAALAVIDAAAWVLGALLERLLPRSPLPAQAALRPLIRVALGFGALALLALALAALQLAVAPALIALVVGPLLAGGVIWRAELRAALARIRDRPRRPWRRATIALAAALGLLLLGPLLAAFVPHHGWDALTYHLALPERYLFAGRIVVTPLSIFSTFPHTVEMLNLIALPLGGPALAKLLHLQFGLLALWTAFVSGRRFSPRAALLAPCFLLAEALVLREMTWAYNDLASVFFSLLAVSAAIDWLVADDRPALLRAAMLAGLALGTRYTGGAAALAIVVATWSPPRWRRARANARATLVFVAVVAAVVAPWLLRNAATTGNPVAPMMQRAFHPAGQEFFDPVAVQQTTAFVRSIGHGRSVGALLALPWNATMASPAGRYDASFGHPLAALHVVGLAAALLAWLLWRDATLGWLLKAAGVATLAWFFTIQEARLLLPALAVLAVAGAAGLDLLAQAAPRWGRLLYAVPAAALVIGQLGAAAELPLRYGLALGSLSQADFARRDPLERAAAALRRELRPGDRLLLIYESRGYAFRGLDYLPFHINEGSPTLQLIHRQPSVRALRCALAALGVTHVLLNKANLRRFRPAEVPRYGIPELRADLARVIELLETWSSPIYWRDGIAAARLHPVAGACEGRSPRGRAPRVGAGSARSARKGPSSRPAPLASDMHPVVAAGKDRR